MQAPLRSSSPRLQAYYILGWRTLVNRVKAWYFDLNPPSFTSPTRTAQFGKNTVEITRAESESTEPILRCTVPQTALVTQMFQ